MWKTMETIEHGTSCLAGFKGKPEGNEPFWRRNLDKWFWERHGRLKLGPQKVLKLSPWICETCLLPLDLDSPRKTHNHSLRFPPFPHGTDVRDPV